MFLTILLFLILLILPFFPGIIELIRKRDIEPLYIKQEFSKDPAFFGRSFKKLLSQALIENAKKISEDTLVLSLSSAKREFLKLYHDFIEGIHHDEIVYCKGDKIRTKDQFVSNKEVVIEGHFEIIHPCIMRSLLVDGDLMVKNSLKVFRWIHVEGRVEISSINGDTDLGINLYAKEIRINSSCTFKRIFADKIEVGKVLNEESFTRTMINQIKGTLRTKGNLKINVDERNLVIEGDIISDKDIIIKGNVWVKGNVFSHGGVVFLKSVIIGEEKKIKSVVGKRRVILGNGVKVYGYIHTDGRGIVKL